MGCVNSKKHELDDATRRRLSLSQSDPVVSQDEAPERGKVTAVVSANLLDVFPDTSRRFSLSGKHADGQQKGFENKVIEAAGSSAQLYQSALKIGFACKKGLKPESPNQDDFCILLVDDWGFFGVFDGHGPYGHDISSFVHDALPGYLVRNPTFHTDPTQALQEAFQRTQNECAQRSDRGLFDAAMSGTTGACCIWKDKSLHIAHVGDSRVVTAHAKDSTYSVGFATGDHKPCSPGEKERIARRWPSAEARG